MWLPLEVTGDDCDLSQTDFTVALNFSVKLPVAMGPGPRCRGVVVSVAPSHVMGLLSQNIGTIYTWLWMLLSEGSEIPEDSDSGAWKGQRRLPLKHSASTGHPCARPWGLQRRGHPKAGHARGVRVR